MGLLQDLAAAAIRKQVIGALRAECPVELKTELETMLADDAAMSELQKIVMAAMTSKRSLTTHSLDFLQLSPALAEYLCSTANAKLPH